MVSLGISGTYALDVSADGSVVVGYGIGAFRWTTEAGMVTLAEQGQSRGVSADGSVVVGVKDDWPFRWTAETGLVRLGDGASANAVSGDS